MKQAVRRVSTQCHEWCAYFYNNMGTKEIVAFSTLGSLDFSCLHAPLCLTCMNIITGSEQPLPLRHFTEPKASKLPIWPVHISLKINSI